MLIDMDACSEPKALRTVQSLGIRVYPPSTESTVPVVEFDVPQAIMEDHPDYVFGKADPPQRGGLTQVRHQVSVLPDLAPWNVVRMISPALKMLYAPRNCPGAASQRT